VGCGHHITQRGNNRADVFFLDDDRRVYLELLAEQADKYGLEVVRYCLLTNHVHLVAIPHAEEALAQAVGRTHFRYSQYVNRLHGRSGHLWQGRFYSCALDERHFWQALKYVELNPVWSSIRCGRGCAASPGGTRGRVRRRIRTSRRRRSCWICRAGTTRSRRRRGGGNWPRD